MSPDRKTWELIKPYIEQVTVACSKIYEQGWCPKVEFLETKDGLQIMVTVDKPKTFEKIREGQIVMGGDTYL